MSFDPENKAFRLYFKAISLLINGDSAKPTATQKQERNDIFTYGKKDTSLSDITRSSNDNSYACGGFIYIRSCD